MPKRVLRAFSSAALMMLIPAALFVPQALAGERIGTELTGPFSWDPGSLRAARGVAVSKEQGGAIYVVDGESAQRVDEFKPDGTFVRAFGWGIVPGAAKVTGNLTLGSTSVINAAVQSGQISQGGAGGEIVSGPGVQAGTRIESVGANSFVLSKPATATSANVTMSVAAGPGNVPTNEVQKLTVKAASGSFTLAFISPKPGTQTLTTAPLASGATAGQVETALANLANVGAGNVSVSGGPGNAEGSNPYLIEFKGRFADTNVRKLSVANVSLSGGIPSTGAGVATATEGGGAMEACTTVCGPPSVEENARESGAGFGGSFPGALNWDDEIAVDNDPASASYGDVYLVDQRNFRVAKYGPEGEFLLLFGGEVDKTTHADVCTAADLAGGDVCGSGVPGTGPSHFYKEEPQTQAGGFKSWEKEGSNSIAVGPEGTVYVGDFGRIQKFNPDGAFAGELGFGEAEPKFVVSLALDSEGNVFERSVNYGGELEVRAEVPGIREYNPSGSLIRTFDTGPGNQPIHVSVDAGGNVYASESKESQAGTPPVGDSQDFFVRAAIKVFDPSGTEIAELASEQLQNKETPGPTGYKLRTQNPQGMAIGDAAGTVYGTAPFPEGDHVAAMPMPAPGPPVVGGESVTGIQPQTATLHGFVNPREFDTEYHFEYVDDSHYQGEGFASAATRSTPAVPLGLVERTDAAQAAVSGLSTATKYHYRLVAESTRNGGETVHGAGATFETLPAVSIRNLSTLTVGPERVTFQFEINPNDSLAPTHYELRYGTSNAYGSGVAEGTVPGATGEFVTRQVTFSGLGPDSTYHYKLTAEDEYGAVATSDQTFTTEPSAGEEREREDCPNGSIQGEPNSALREENNSLGLPDCRAYEQVSEVHKEGGTVYPTSSLSPEGERSLYSSEGVFAGASVNEAMILYLAHRTEGGWVTQPVLTRPSAEPTLQPTMTQNELDFSPSLDRWLFGSIPALGQNEAFQTTKSLYLSQGFAAGGAIVRASPEISLIEGPQRPWFVIAPLRVNGYLSYTSDDLTRQYLKTNARLLPALADPRPDGWATFGPISIPTMSDRIYELSGIGSATPALSLVTELPPGLSVSTGGESTTGCGIDDEVGGSNDEVSAVSVFQNHTARLVSNDATTMVYSQPIEIEAGAGCGEGNPNPIGLFVHQSGQGSQIQLNAPPAAQCHAPNPCASSGIKRTNFLGLSPDGSKAWFATTRPLVDSDTDASGDLYLAKLGAGGVEELVQASAGEVTPSHPNPGQGAGVLGGERVSADGTRVAYLATGVLTSSPNALGESPVQGGHNLYVYDAESDETHFVTRLPNSVFPAREPAFTFSPDDRYLVFATSAGLTADDTDSRTDIYRYDFQSGALVRLSFGRDGNALDGNDESDATLPHGSALQEPNNLAEDSNRYIGAGGAVVIFETDSPLVSQDTNEAGDVYEWEEEGHGTCEEGENGSGGCVRLISDGVDRHGATHAVIGSSGRDITFQTPRGEAPGDTDGVGDIYDARVDGGFPYQPPGEQCGSAETCHGEGTSESVRPAYTSEELRSGGNGPQELECAKGRHRVKKHGQVRCVPNKHHKHKHKRRRHGRAARRNQGGSR